MRGSARGLHRRLAVVASTVLVAAVSIAVALLVIPMQQVSRAGQTVGVGAAAPSLSVSGPGELDLFGQRLPTTLRFDGPVRPRLALTQITLGSQLATAFAPHRPSPEQAIGAALAAGWTRYFAWEIVLTAGCALLRDGGQPSRNDLRHRFRPGRPIRPASVRKGTTFSPPYLSASRWYGLASAARLAWRGSSPTAR